MLIKMMWTEMQCPRFSLRCSAIIFAGVLVALAPTRLPADEISVQSSAGDSEADTVYLDYTVNPDGSVTADMGPPFTNAPALGSWYLDPFDGPGVDFPALPPGSIITSATFSYDIGSSIGWNGDPFFTAEGTVTPPYSVSFTTATFGSPGCSWAIGNLQSASGSFSFSPCSTDEQFYSVSFTGGDDLTAQFWDPNLFPGDYGTAVNLGVGVGYAITVDYVTTPEPRTYGPVAGLAMVMIFAWTRRMRSRSGIA